jgi:hypothetical protein
MKNFYLLSLFMFFGFVSQITAQVRLLEEVFTDVKVTSNIPYANNITVITGAPTLQTLLLDVYEPEGDVATKRPLIIMFHTGNFLPHPQNQGTGGLKTDSTVVGMARRLAKMGYVVASAQYRLGWNPVAPTQEQRVNLLINAAYRGVQDANTSIRYFRKTVAEDANPYNIDHERITIWGFGTGGYITLNTTALTTYEKTLIPKFIGEDLQPMVKSGLSGDPYGITQAPLNIPNHVGYSSDFALSVNLGGAIGDTSWMQPGLQPMISFQVPSDPFAPYVEGIVVVPGLGLPVVEVQGAYLVQLLANQYGNNNVFVDANINDVYTTVANSRNDGFEGLYPMPRAQGSENDSSPWDWWSPDNPNHNNGLQTNPDMSFAKAMLMADTILGYFAPRAYAAMNLDELSSVRSLTLSQANISLSPNPANNEVFLISHNNMPIREIQVMDIQGRVVNHFTNIDNSYFTIRRNNLPDGIYFIHFRMDDGVVTKKLIYK